ncbi:mutT/nudix family protein [Halarchaeum acidiphilum MH1-52-1]|uniref:MutT/nudix family protein n=1 Tax=Halarchaeum acidiphilum MH1-52-1 TaxID=1261545 RepID=U2YSU9_9EURY|nr:NUDIX domain-containing protein [Halarchaeum acidiphilum]GAD51802.1 mutT/nudix family protein [Halarchaeum acidiphilum MH1-52-1]
MSSEPRRIEEKAYAYVTRDGSDLLVFEPPDGEGPQVPKGGVEPDEDPADAVLRELREETGLGDATLCAHVATDEWSHLTKPKAYRRYFYHVRVDAVPDRWSHEVTGGGEDDGLVYACYWVDLATAAERLVREQGAYLDALDDADCGDASDGVTQNADRTSSS